MAKITQSHTVPSAGAAQGKIPAAIRPAPNRAPFSPGYEHPVQFGAAVAVPSGSEAAIRGRALANTFTKTIEIHEIRFLLTMTPDETAGAVTQVSLGGMISAHLAVGKVPLTNGPVPIWCLTPIYSRFDEDSFSDTSLESASSYVWKLARPFHLPPGAQLSARFRHNGLVRQNVTSRCVIAGRVVNKAPRTTAAPFASAFVGTPQAVEDVAFDEVAAETALANVTGAHLQVDRFIGRIAAHQPSIPTANAVAFSDANHPEVSRLYGLRLLASDGQPVIRDLALFRAIFPYSTASWECPHTMKPNDFYRLTVQRQQGAAPPYDWQRGQAFVSLVGSREVPL